MNPIYFSSVNSRKVALNSKSSKYEKISYGAVKENLTPKNLLLFIESGSDNNDLHSKRSFYLYDQLLKESTDLPDNIKGKLQSAINSNLIKVSDLNSVYNVISNCKNIADKTLFFDTLEDLENCDRIIRNESKISKRFDLQKIINENLGYGCQGTVYELCSLLDTYNISSKVKMNIALENIEYALFKSGHKINLNEVTEYITEYFFNRDAIITDKDYNGYINVLENNSFINLDKSNVSYIFEFKNTKGNLYSDKLQKLSSKCQSPECASFIEKVLNIKNEKDASNYIEESIDYIINDKFSKWDSLLLLKSIYIIPLIGDVSKDFIIYKMEITRKKIKIKNKISDTENKEMIKKLLDDGNIIDSVDFLFEGVSFDEETVQEAKDYKKGDLKNYVIKTVKSSPEKDDSKSIEKIIDSFKASNDKSASKFKNMLSRIMTKSPDNIINETPNIFGVVKIIMYAGIAVMIPMGPIFAAIIAFITKLITMDLDLKQAEKLLKHLKSEKEKAEKKLKKLSGKEKDNQKEYIKTLDKCINKVKDFISKIDDDNEELYGGDDNSDDFNFDDDFNWESSLILSESSNIENKSIPHEVISMLSPSVDGEILTNLSDLFDNCYGNVSDAFYNKIKSIMNDSKDQKLIETCQYILNNKGNGKLIPNEEPGFIAHYEAVNTLQEILTESKDNNKKGNFLGKVKMANLNFKKKAQTLQGKSKELWRNIDMNTARLSNDIQQALTSQRREGIIKGSIIPSFSQIIKYAIAVGAVGAFTGPVGAIITAVGIFGASKALNERERRLIYDEIDTELQVVEKQLQLAENEGDMNQYRFLLNYQKKLQREKYRIKYHINMGGGRPIPELKKGED